MGVASHFKILQQKFSYGQVSYPVCEQVLLGLVISTPNGIYEVSEENMVCYGG